MKTLTLLAAILAVGTSTAFAAPCTSGSALSALSATTCQVSNGAFTWDLSGWGMNPGIGQNYAGNPTPAATDILVTFNSVFGNGTLGANGALGFSVTFSDATGGNNYFSAVTGQAANWENYFYANDQGSGAADIKEVYHQAADGSSSGTGEVSIKKEIITVNGAPQVPSITASIVFSGGTTTGNNPGQMLLPSNSGLVGVIDTYSISAASAGAGGTASISGYTNYFFSAPGQAIPEPMSFVLMGAGLAGIVALRRGKK